VRPEPIQNMLERLELFSDSREIVMALSELADQIDYEGIGLDDYWIQEAIVHIEGLYHLAGQMAEHIEVMAAIMDASASTQPPIQRATQSPTQEDD
jgi:hypothetical protein